MRIVCISDTHMTHRSNRKERVEKVQAILNQPNSEDREEAMREMASIRGVTPEALLQNYVERGLQADVARLQRAENKPSNRPIPFTRVP